MPMLDNYERFLGELSKASSKNFKNVNNLPSQEAINNVLLSEQNAVLKQIGVALAIIADELHELNNKPADLAEEGYTDPDIAIKRDFQESVNKFNSDSSEEG